MIYHFLVRTMFGASDIEQQLRSLSEEGWEPINFARDASGAYEVILRREQSSRLESAVLQQLESTTTIEATDLSS